MINENDIRRHIIAALLNEPILGQNYVDYHNEKRRVLRKDYVSW